MTEHEAFSLLVQATASIQANREVHGKIQEALKVLQPKEESTEE